MTVIHVVCVASAERERGCGGGGREIPVSVMPREERRRFMFLLRRLQLGEYDFAPMWVDLVVGTRPCTKGFFLVFLFKFRFDLECLLWTHCTIHSGKNNRHHRTLSNQISRTSSFRFQFYRTSTIKVSG